MGKHRRLLEDIKRPKTQLEAFEYANNAVTANIVSNSIFSKKIKVTTPYIREHRFERSPFSKHCVCADCYGDFSGASEDYGDGR